MRRKHTHYAEENFTTFSLHERPDSISQEHGKPIKYVNKTSGYSQIEKKLTFPKSEHSARKLKNIDVQFTNKYLKQ